MDKKEKLNEKYNLAFNNESFNLGYSLYKKIERKFNNFNLFLFLSSITFITILLSAEKFTNSLLTEKILLLLIYVMFIPLIYSIWNILFVHKVSFDSKIIKLIDLELYNEVQSKKSQIENYFFDRNNLENIFLAMNYCKVEFNQNFSMIETRVSTVDLAELLLKGFKSKDILEMINNSIEIKSKIYQVLSNKNMKAVTY